MYSGKQYYINSNFDFQLSGLPQPGEGLLSRIQELPLHCILLGQKQDGIILPTLPRCFLEYLGSKNILPPNYLSSPDFRQNLEFTPFGWSSDAVSINNKMLRPSPHPAPEHIFTINSKCFSHELNMKMRNPISQAIHSSKELVTVKNRLSKGTWILKAPQGNSGFANKLVCPHAPFPQKWCERILQYQGCILVEPFHNRLLDWGTQFNLSLKGTIVDPVCYQLLNTRGGSFRGVMNFSESESFQRLAMMRPVLSEVAASLNAYKYWGPVNIDSYEYSQDGKPKTRFLVEINARLSMASVFLSIKSHLKNPPFILWKFYTLKNRCVATGMNEFQTLLGKNNIQPEQFTGILLTSPLPSANYPLKQISLAFSAGSQKKLFALESAFRKILNKYLL